MTIEVTSIKCSKNKAKLICIWNLLLVIMIVEHFENKMSNCRTLLTLHLSDYLYTKLTWLSFPGMVRTALLCLKTYCYTGVWPVATRAWCLSAGARCRSPPGHSAHHGSAAGWGSWRWWCHWCSCSLTQTGALWPDHETWTKTHPFLDRSLDDWL